MYTPGADPGFDQGRGGQIVTGLKLPFWGLSFGAGASFLVVRGGPGPPPWIRPCTHTAQFQAKCFFFYSKIILSCENPNATKIDQADPKAVMNIYEGYNDMCNDLGQNRV